MARCSITVLAVTAFVTSMPADAAPPTVLPSVPAPNRQAQIDIVAKNLCAAEPVVGTRLAVRRRCDTPAELANYQRQAREYIESYRHQPCVAGTGGGERDTLLPC
jgi:hypothetical protein